VNAAVYQVAAIDDLDFVDTDTDSTGISLSQIDPSCIDAWLADLRRGAKAVQASTGAAIGARRHFAASGAVRRLSSARRTHAALSIAVALSRTRDSNSID
jgi:hypothetical protein